MKHNAQSAFSLIELLAAMAILMVIVLMMTTIFSNSDRVWSLGTGRANNCTDGRAAMNLLAHDLEYAVADDILTFAMDYKPKADNALGRDNLITYGFTNNEICFVSLLNNATNSSSGARQRTAWEFHYYLKEVTNHIYALRRAYYSDITTDANAHSYKNRTWYKTSGKSLETGADNPGRPTGGGILAQNVVGFSLYVPGPPLGAISRTYYSDPNVYTRVQDKVFVTNRLPAYVDICLEVLDEDAMERAADLAGNFGEDDEKTREYVEKNMRRYTTRVYFDNRNGYKRRFNLLR